MAAAPYAAISGDAAAEDEEAFYNLHREELLEVLKGPSGNSGQSWHEVYASLEPRHEDGVGILNQGATCYMNSLLQVLFHTLEFRLAVYAFKFDAVQHGAESRCIPLQLQKLFVRMQASSVSAVSTTGLTVACGLSDHTGEQHDVQELCRVLFDALGRSSTFLKDEIDRLYSGKTVQYIRTVEPHDGKTYESSRKEAILDLQVPIMGCKTLEQAIQKLVEPEEMNGENQWACEDLGKKVDALKGLEFESLPMILHVQLLRFVFDLTTLRRKKLSDNLSIPLELDMQSMLGTGSEPLRYELSGMCVQFGQAGGGHYIAKVRDGETGRWLNANDKSVTALTEEQMAGLFKARSKDALSSSAPAGQEDTTVALDSTDAYYLVYRKVTLEKHKVSDADVPNIHLAEILAENERLKVLQRAYTIHRNLVEITVFAPSAPELALRLYTAHRLDGLLSPGQDTFTGEQQSICVSAPRSRSVANVLRQALSEFAKKAAEDEGWAWAAGLGDAACTTVGRLRRYEKVYGYVKEPLAEHTQIGDHCGATSGSSRIMAMLELCTAGRSFEAWEPGMFEIVLCRWDGTAGGISLASGDLHILKLPSEEQTAVEQDSPAEATASHELATVGEEAEPEAPAYDPYSEEMPDLFGDSEPQYPQPAAISTEMSVLTGKIRRIAASALGFEHLAIIPMTGSAAGKVLSHDNHTLAKLGVSASDVLCAEAMTDADLQATAQYELVRNSAHLAFNHPDRPEYTEEFKLSIPKDVTVEKLKAAIGQQLSLNGRNLHLCRDSTKPQIKDEDKTLREVGLADATYVFVGHGAPVPPDHTMLQVYVYSAEQGSAVKTKDASFSVAAKGTNSVKYLRKLVLEPLIEWAQSVISQHAEGVGAELLKNASFPLEGLTWKRLRLRDAQAGKQYAILRDERTLRSSLLGFSDGRQVAIQVLDFDEELAPEEVLIQVYPWLVQESRILTRSEVVVNKTQSLKEFRDALTAKFKQRLLDEQIEITKNSEEPEAEDSLELAAMPSVAMAVTPRQSLTLKWSDCRLNTDKPEAWEKPLSEFKEVRDGVVLVMRSKLDAAKGPPAGKGANTGANGSGKGPGKGPKAKAKSFSSVQEGALAMSAKAKSKSKASKPYVAEKGIHIEVACPESHVDLKTPESVPAADGESPQ